MDYNIITTFIFLLFSAFFSASETALFSIPRELISVYEKSNRKTQLWIYALLDDGQRTLLCILLGNLAVNVTVVGFIHKVLNNYFPHNTVFGTLAIATVTILLFGEVVPKNIAIRHYNTIAMLIAPVLFHLKIIIYPLLFILQKLNIIFLYRFSRFLRKPSPFITLLEFKNSISDHYDNGVISKEEWDIIQPVLKFGNEPVSRFLIHRSQVCYIHRKDSASDVCTLMSQKKQTFCCVRSEVDADGIAGLVFLSDILKTGKKVSINSLIVQPVWMPNTSDLGEILDYMFREKIVVACIHDEFGAFDGLLTFEKGLSEMMKLPEENTCSKTTVLGGVLKEFDGFTELDQIREWVPPSLQKLSSSVRTLNGLITSYLGKIPKSGVEFAIDGFKFYIIASRLNCIETIRIQKKG